MKLKQTSLYELQLLHFSDLNQNLPFCSHASNKKHASATLLVTMAIFIYHFDPQESLYLPIYFKKPYDEMRTRISRGKIRNLPVLKFITSLPKVSHTSNKNCLASNDRFCKQKWQS